MHQTMKKRIIALAAILFTAIMTLAPVTASAEIKTYYQNLSAGTWAQESYQSGYGYTYYIVKASKPGMFTFTFKDAGSPAVYIYDNKKDLENYGHTGSYKRISYQSDCKKVAVEAGTYYLKVDSGVCKYSFTAEPSAANYSVAKATKLAAKKTVTAMFTPTKNFARWYKISNTSKKKISFTANTSDIAYNTEVYNSKMQKLEMVKDASGLKYTTKVKQAKGTYYIRIKSKARYYSDYDYRFGDVATLKWQ